MLQNIALSNLHEDLRSANRMSEERFAKLVENIRETGQMQPLIVRLYPKKKQQFVIIDGHYRKKACEQLGQTEVLCLVWDITEKESGLLLASLNRLRGEDHPGKRAELLNGLKQDYGVERLCQLIPENEHQLKELLALLDQQEDSLKDMLERQQAEEAKLLPVILSFVLSKNEAEQVQKTLVGISEDQNVALVQLCERVQDGQ
jgi:ParB/RepB/Spo0J family partition protein